MTTLAMKFGGSAIGTISALTQVLSIVLHERTQWKHVLIIASALDGVTDMLLEAGHLAQLSNHRGYRRIAATLRTRHLALVEQLPLGTTERAALQADVDRLLFEMLDICQQVSNTPGERLSAEVSDKVVCVGERLSARIIAALLRQNGLRGVAIDGTDIIVTDTIHGNATPIFDLTQQRVNENLNPMLERQIIPVVTGFIGMSTDGKTTTMGRGGSDYTASILSLCTNASEVWVWSGVDGMMTADPHEVDNARVIEQLTYEEVAEMAFFGARILHPRMITPLKDHQIPLRVKNVYKPQQAGTLISNQETPTPSMPKAVTVIQGIGLHTNRSGDVSEITKTVDNTLFDVAGIHAEVTITSQSSMETFMSCIIPTSVGNDIIDSLTSKLHFEIETLNDTSEWHVEPVSIVTIIGQDMSPIHTWYAKIFGAIEGTTIKAIAFGPSNCSLSLVIDQFAEDDVIEQLHQLILSLN